MADAVAEPVARGPLSWPEILGERDDRRPFWASPQIDKLATALAAAQLDMPTIEKNKTASIQGRANFKYDYADLAHILSITRPVLAHHGLTVLQPPTGRDNGTVTVMTIVLHTSGQWLAAALPIPVRDDGDPQKLGSALSYVRRYHYCGTLGIQPDDEDDDGQAATSRRPQQRRREPDPGDGVATDSGEQRITTTNPDGSKGGQKARLLGILKEHKVDAKEFGAHLHERYGYTGWDEIRRKHYDEIVALAQAWPKSVREPGEEG